IKDYLRPESTHIRSRAVSSIRAIVTNLKPLLANMDAKYFRAELQKAVIQHFGDEGVFELDADALQQIKKLSESKYKSSEWNFGYSPDYTIENKLETTGFSANFQLKVNKGTISTVMLSAGNNNALSREIEEALDGKFHHPKDLSQALEPLLNARNYTETEQLNLITQFF
ncbi:MAG: hypothetical protein K8F24_04430, partial [Bacteroidales bacterium]|nr:hypothetical protein [Bacteroidales bacterium]